MMELDEDTNVELFRVLTSDEDVGTQRRRSSLTVLLASSMRSRGASRDAASRDPPKASMRADAELAAAGLTRCAPDLVFFAGEAYVLEARRQVFDFSAGAEVAQTELHCIAATAWGLRGATAAAAKLSPGRRAAVVHVESMARESRQLTALMEHGAASNVLIYFLGRERDGFAQLRDRKRYRHRLLQLHVSQRARDRCHMTRAVEVPMRRAAATESAVLMLDCGERAFGYQQRHSPFAEHALALLQARLRALRTAASGGARGPLRESDFWAALDAGDAESRRRETEAGTQAEVAALKLALQSGTAEEGPEAPSSLWRVDGLGDAAPRLERLATASAGKRLSPISMTDAKDRVYLVDVQAQHLFLYASTPLAPGQALALAEQYCAERGYAGLVSTASVGPSVVCEAFEAAFALT